MGITCKSNLYLLVKEVGSDWGRESLKYLGSWDDDMHHKLFKVLTFFVNSNTDTRQFSTLCFKCEVVRV